MFDFSSDQFKYRSMIHIEVEVTLNNFYFSHPETRIRGSKCLTKHALNTFEDDELTVI